MKWTLGRIKDKECISWFIPAIYDKSIITDEDWETFFAQSERGIVPMIKTAGYEAICQGKSWRGIHIHEMYEEGVLDGSFPYVCIIGEGSEILPRGVVDFFKKEMFKGADAEVIENLYQQLIK